MSLFTRVLQKKGVFLWMQHSSFELWKETWSFHKHPEMCGEDQQAPPPCLQAWQAHTKYLWSQHHILTVAHTCTLGMLCFLYHRPPWQYQKPALHLQTLKSCPSKWVEESDWWGQSTRHHMPLLEWGHYAKHIRNPTSLYIISGNADKCTIYS